MTSPVGLRIGAILVVDSEAVYRANPEYYRRMAIMKLVADLVEAQKQLVEKLLASDVVQIDTSPGVGDFPPDRPMFGVRAMIEISQCATPQTASAASATR